MIIQTKTKERPIIFSAPMVQAILGGAKTMTRRALTPGKPHTPWKVGDLLWVRETFITGWPAEDGIVYDCDDDGNELPEHVWFRATTDSHGEYTGSLGVGISGWTNDDCEPIENITWKPSIHMPRWASRITLRVTGVGLERLQDITEADAGSEGAFWVPEDDKQQAARVAISEGMDCCGPREYFRSYWDTLNAWRGHGWEHNPLVEVDEFETVKP